MAVTSAGVDPASWRRSGASDPQIGKEHNLKLADFDLVEVNEAFAAQVLACDRELHSIATS